MRKPQEEPGWIVIVTEDWLMFDRTLDRKMKIVDRFEGPDGRRTALIECPRDRLGFLPTLLDDLGSVAIYQDQKQARKLAKELTQG